ncbi:hypothetical protein tinsulaeT_34390 [Thalassotalea insulae]|uniref:DUF3108 domain-containing protein n=1 Tax=Thalassotalea insulae TaxID=2056778 RepID=A0ABQ6GWR2_9GAMM|nr:DUF3108 domain-containing protein [Thalassotalea insulae]GLX80099.1 hypothetical protein tinsulaeT_34390 [Thalassotalea insulae]
MIRALCFCCLATLSSVSGAETVPTNQNIEVKPFTAEYSILHKGSSVGKGIRALTQLANGQIQYSYQTEIEWLIFSDSRKETSVVTIENGHVTPVHYQFNREGTGRDKYYEWQYDIANNKATDIKKKQTIDVEFPFNIQDKLSYHLQNRLNLIANPEQKLFVYPVISSSGKIKNHVYQYEGEEEIMLPYGLVKAIKLKREVIEKKRITYAWFAPELNYLLVKLYQAKGGVEQFEAQLTSVSINNDKQANPIAN